MQQFQKGRKKRGGGGERSIRPAGRPIASCRLNISITRGEEREKSRRSYEKAFAPYLEKKGGGGVTRSGFPPGKKGGKVKGKAGEHPQLVLRGEGKGGEGGKRKVVETPTYLTLKRKGGKRRREASRLSKKGNEKKEGWE